MLFKSKKVLGLDIGTSTIKLAEMNVSGRGATLEAFSYISTPVNAMSGGELSDINNLATAVQGAAAELKSKRKNVCVGMAGTAIIVKRISIPKADKGFISEQLGFYAEQYIPFDINNISLTYHILETSPSFDTVDLLLVAAQNELVSQYSQVVVSAGLNCAILDVSGFAVANCFEMNYGKMKGENIGIINFGASVSNFVILSQGEIAFCRDIPVGGGNYTSEISKALGVTTQEAEALKMSAVSKREVPDDVHSIIATTNELINEEIKNSLDFLNATSSHINLSRIFYTGGAAGTTGLIDTVQKSTGLRMEFFNPFQRIRVNSRRLNAAYISQITPVCTVAMGLGLRQMGDS
jgi:type IV pilus assembly protein PilM